LGVLPDGATIKRFYKEKDSYEDLKDFVINVMYVLVYQKKELEAKNSDRGL
jgi:hypothetical protein